MKLLIICLVAITAIGSGVYPQGTAEGWSSASPLVELTAFAEDEHLDMQELNITLKEEFNQLQLDQTRESITNYFDEPEMKQETTSEATKYIFHDGHKDNDIVETFTVLVPKSEINSFEVVYTVTSAGTTPLAPQIMEQFVDRVKHQIFTKDVTYYSFIKSEYSGIMNEVLFYQKFKKTFNIATIEESTEESWSSRSGYTSRWGQAIELPEGSMNVQFATRNLGNRTTVTFGTPILTAEY
ncbi:YwmB family TATA-box binding protein [Halobacillus sp. A5]|uniref:YwmB family TATA-box binding protein n=1 Tax=Halobacillus sp. A5 TaxID=2880263 RepID=UPI0020A647B5|nr:YwmB family TATA-box binding protein [Halobacillus sp. A5]MCP3027589.1 YwmB family TATA-box binding protein [Halobacillus sp. A5]